MGPCSGSVLTPLAIVAKTSGLFSFLGQLHAFEYKYWVFFGQFNEFATFLIKWYENHTTVQRNPMICLRTVQLSQKTQ